MSVSTDKERLWNIVIDSASPNHFLRRLPDCVHYLFSYFEYVGSDFAADMARLAADPVTERWWALCKPCQDPLPDRSPDEWWASMEEVFHHD